ncbi:unnamed protein product [Miscanthus lutarioriparius]|uniref:Uncharacterized protein n=1 Tax=Miscanthus lutarioriparius TaxID=422564 RepID=A0A811MXP1_9POAL|nr:unnamed protein product [Miscanthus lutarioriparius]
MPLNYARPATAGEWAGGAAAAACGAYHEDAESLDSLLFHISTLWAATCNFAESNRLGEGGFGAVYKVWQHWTTDTVEEILDSALRGDAPGRQILKCVHIGLLCVQSNPDDSPMMSTVNVMLSSSNVSLSAPLKPVFFIPQSGVYSAIDSETHPTASQSIGRSGALSGNEV